MKNKRSMKQKGFTKITHKMFLLLNTTTTGKFAIAEVEVEMQAVRGQKIKGKLECQGRQNTNASPEKHILTTLCLGAMVLTQEQREDSLK